MEPIFPQFKKLELSHRKLIQDFTSAYPPYSDFDFTSMYTYDTCQKIRWCFLNHNLVVQFTDYITNKPFLSFLGHFQVIKTALTLIDYSKQNALPAYLKLIPETVIKSSKQWHKYFQIQEDRDNFDYLISIKEAASLPEPKFHRKRSLLVKFQRQNRDYQVKIVDLRDDKTKNTLIKLFKQWEKLNHKNRSETETELMAIKRLCKASAKLKIYTLLIYVNNKAIAFNTFEKTHNGYAISSFQKADKNFRGIYTTLSHESAKFLYQKNCRQINYEQDLGISGLRLSKSLWKPVRFLKKYIVSPK